MSFNEEKCKVLHIGYHNEKATYTMNGTQLKSIEREKDLGVTISNDLKSSQQCSEPVNKANKIIGLIGRSFEHKSKEVILTLYNSLVRPHFEYCVQALSPYYKKDIHKLERVQRRVTKMIPSLITVTLLILLFLSLMIKSISFLVTPFGLLQVHLRPILF